VHRLLGWEFVARRVPGVRPRLALVCAIERLEGRVVPSTILVTSLANSGHGTLRAAIEKADHNPNDSRGGTRSDTIKFAPSVNGTIFLTSALPVLSTHIVISWPPQAGLGTGFSSLTVARSRAPGTPAFSIFTVAKNAVVAITSRAATGSLTIAGGSAPDGGAIDNAGSLSLVSITINGNSAVGLGSGSVVATLGGGIENTGKLSVTDCFFTNNSATGSTNETGDSGYGGAIANSGRLSITASEFFVNSATGGGGQFAGNGGGGAIENSGLLTIAACQFAENSASGGSSNTGISGDGDGGAIMNTGTLSITESAVGANSAKGSFDSFGGGIYNSGTLSVINSGFDRNLAQGGFDSFGGGIYNSAMLSATDTDFTANSATSLNGTAGGAITDYGYGGGIDNSGTLSVTNACFLGNSATSLFGTGGVPTADYGYGGGIDNSGALSVANATFIGNSATGVDGSFGGGIADSGAASISYVTADDNSAATGGGVAITPGAQPVVDSIDSIYQNTQGGNVAVAAGSFRSLGHNLFSDDPAVSLSPTDLVNTDPLLGPLSINNGGNTETQALLPGSPAINAGISVAGITTDQRGAPRPLTGATDIGAFQVQPPLTVVSLRRSGTERLVLTFNLPLDASPAESLANYRLVQAGGNERVISIRSAQYDVASQSVTLRLKTRLSLSQTYVLTVIGTPPGGLATTVGAYLAGAAADEPGSNYVATIT